jgi:hypothetical protein
VRWLIATLLSLSASAAFAGAQIYEPLSASVQAALHKAVSDALKAKTLITWLQSWSPNQI